MRFILKRIVIKTVHKLLFVFFVFRTIFFEKELTLNYIIKGCLKVKIGLGKVVFLIVLFYLLSSCSCMKSDLGELDGIPESWNGKYSIESSPELAVLDIRDGKIFSAITGDELFPAKFMEKRSKAYYYSDRAIVKEDSVEYSFSKLADGSILYSSSTKTLILKYRPYVDLSTLGTTTTTSSTTTTTVKLYGLDVLKGIPAEILGGEQAKPEDGSLIVSPEGSTNLPIEQGPPERVIIVPTVPAEWNGIYARANSQNKKALIIRDGKIFYADGKGDIEAFPKGLEEVSSSRNRVEVSSEFGNIKVDFIYNRDPTLRQILYTNFDGAVTNYVIYVEPPKVPRFSFISNIGSSGEGRLNKPYSVSVDDKNIYVLDTDNNMVQVFRKTDNKFLYNFGGWGTVDGKFNGPKGINIDERFIYIADSDNNRIQIFEKNGKFVKTIGSITETFMEGYFNNPRGIAVDEKNLYIIETGNSRVQIIDKKTYEYVTFFGSKGRKTGYFYNPREIAIDDKYLYVSDSGNHRVQIFDKKELDHGKIASIGSQGGGDGQFYYPEGLVAGVQYLYVVDYGNSRITIFNKEPPFNFAGKLGERGDDDEQFAYPKGITIDKNNFYVADTENNRISIFNSNTGAFVSTFGSRKPEPKEFNMPKGIAVDRSLIYIADSGNNRIQVLDKNGNFVTMFDGKSGVALGQLFNPTALFKTKDSLYVADTNNSRIVVFNRLGASTLEFGSEGTREGKFRFPMGVFADEENIIVADTNNHRIQIFDLDGNFLNVFGEDGFVDGTLHKPEGVYADRDKIYIANTGNNRIEIFDRKTLAFDSRFGREGANPGEFEDIVGIYVDKNYIYTLERKSSRVQVFSRYTKELAFVRSFGSVGSGNGELLTPEAMAVDFERALYITDTNNNRISTIRINMVEQAP